MRDRFLLWLARTLPKSVVYFCTNELIADVTSNEYSGKHPNDVGCMDALGAFSKRHAIWPTRHDVVSDLE